MMINRKDTPAPFMQRVAPPQFHSFGAPDQQSAPQTSQNTKRSKRTAKSHRPTPRETYMDSNARGTPGDGPRDGRISHDLNLTDNTRYSVVDNMLQSLNPEQSNFTPPKDRPAFSSGSDRTTSSSRGINQPRHLHSPSTSSDYTFSLEDSPDRPPYQFGRGRRSHSSSNYQTTLGRIDSVRDKGEAMDAKGAGALRGPKAGPAEEVAKGHARKTSKGSGSSSADFGYTANQNWISNALTRRSASFDHGYRTRALHPASNPGNHPIMPNDLSQSAFYNDLEAAPTPTVPAGPRRDRSPPFPPHPMHAPPVVPQSQRRDSSKSTKSLYGKKNKGDAIHWEPPVPKVASRRGSRQVSAVPEFVKSRQPSPTRQYSEPLMARRQDPRGEPKETVKERPGFFRRMFGSSRGATPAADLQTPARSHPSSRGGTRADSRNGFYAPDTSNKPTPSEDLPHPAPEVNPPPLVKKPSSFFRRRKKSVSESMPPPALPPHLQATASASKGGPGERESVSSLRKVMNPYLDNPTNSPISEAMPVSIAAQLEPAPAQPPALRSTRSFEPPPHSGDSPVADETPSQAREMASAKPAKTHLNPEDITSISKKITPRPIETSFFNDDSSESRTPEIGKNAPFSNQESAPAKPGPTSDMTPQSTKSKDVAEKARRNNVDTTDDRAVLTPRDTNLPSTARSNISTPRKAETRDTPTTSQATPVTKQSSPATSSANPDRVWLRSAHPEEDVRKLVTSNPEKFKDSPMSPESEYFSAASTIHPLRAIEGVKFPNPDAGDVDPKMSIDADPNLPTDADCALAKQIFDGDETIATKAMAAAWLGEPGVDRARIRVAYMQLFEWQNLNILAALRDLCGRLYLKGEAQQVDRILDAFSTRWCACNPQHGFKATGKPPTLRLTRARPRC